MSEIKNIQSKIDTLNSMIEAGNNKLVSTPNDFSLSLSVDSLKNQLSELQSELRIEKVKREKEFVEIRLKGVGADGSISLDFLSKLSNGFAGAILNASTNIQYGNKANKEKAKIVVDTVNLRLVGLAPGSTRLYITANTAPDLFGNSLAEKSLEQSFQLLQSQTSEQLTESASIMGKESVSKLKRFISVINENKLEVDIKWSSPENKAFEWKGEKENMLSIVNSLNKITMSEPETIHVTGELVMISLKGNFELTDNESGNAIKGTYSNEIAEIAKQLNIGHQYTATIEKKKIINEATDAERTHYTLLGIYKA